MKVSLNTVKKYTKVDLPLDDLTDLINQKLGAIEQVIALEPKYQDARIVRVVSAAKHPNADRLSVCLIDDGGQNKSVARDQAGFIQVVCGAPNVRTGMFAIWLPPGSVVPASYDETEPFVIGARELRGVMSFGMLASGAELAINSDHQGIIDLNDSDLPPEKRQKVSDLIGASFAEVFELNDTIIEIENKMFTHRPDLFGQLGVAREIFAITQPEEAKDNHSEQTIIESDWYWTPPVFSSNNNLNLTVFNDAPGLAKRFMVTAFENVKIKASPLWLQTTLVRWGSSPINNVVDLTNYIMLLTAQPVHAYDYDKLSDQTIGVRTAQPGEKIKLLNDKTYQLDSSDIIIADAKKPIGLAGIMGGHETEIETTTTRVVLEVATFDMYSLRKSSMRHGLFTDALTRFNKGQSPLQNDRVLGHLIYLMEDLFAAKQASDVFDVGPAADDDKTSLYGSMTIKASFVSARLGLDLSAVQISNILRLVNFTVFVSDDNPDELQITAPFWRTDIQIPEDIIEEVGRIYGFDKLPKKLPIRSTKPVPKNNYRFLADKISNRLVTAGCNEVLNYSFVHQNTLDHASQDLAKAYKITNALSPDLQYYRLSLLPSLLDKIHANIKAGHDQFALFEFGKSHDKTAGLDQENLPKEAKKLALVYASQKSNSGAAYFKVRKMLEFALKDLKLKLGFVPVTAPQDSRADLAPFDLARVALVFDQNSGQEIGIIGEFNSLARRGFKLPNFCAGFELDVDNLLNAAQINSDRQTYQALSRFPSVRRDICFEVSRQQNYAELEQALLEQLKKLGLSFDLKCLDIFQNQQTKRITVSLKLTSYDKTLTNQQVNQIVENLTAQIKQEIGAKVV